MDWYYASNGQQQGPVSKEQLIELFRGGEVKASDLVWKEGMTDWLPLSSVNELAGEVEASVAPAPEEPAPENQLVEEPALEIPALSAAPRPAAAVGSAAKVPTYLWQSIVCLVLCCMPTAIPAIIYSTKVGPAEAVGDLQAAREASSKAKMWCWISFGVGLVVQTLYLALVGIGMFSELANQ
tara:strand:+ start:2960 stop:3505 length:546 start_codon:yes stop_codon:yes gene_type:complete